MRPRDARALILFAVLVASCGTSLDIRQAERGIAAPSGVVINQRQRLSGTVAVAAGRGRTPLDFMPGRVDVVGVDPLRVLDIGISRDLFASGKLTLDLDERQVALKIGITSTAGSETVVKVINAGVDARNKIVAANEKDP